MIKIKIDRFRESNEKDSEDGIRHFQENIKKQLEKIDQNSEFLKYFKNELKNVAIQLKLEEYFIGILDEPEPIAPISPLHIPDILIVLDS